MKETNKVDWLVNGSKYLYFFVQFLFVFVLLIV